MGLIKWLKGLLPVRRSTYDTIVSVYKMRIADVKRLTEEVEELSCRPGREDTRVATQIVRERMGMDLNAPGKIDILRQQLRQELAVSAWLQENLREGVTVADFDALSKDDRRHYFEEVDALLQ